MASGLIFYRPMFFDRRQTRGAIGRRGDNNARHGDNNARRGDNNARRGENNARHGDDIARRGDTTPDAATTTPDTETTTPDTETTTPGRNGPNGRTGPNRGKKSPFRAKKEKRWPPMKIFRPRSAERVDLFSYFCKGRFPAKLRRDASPPQFCLTLNKNQLLNLWNTPII